MNYLLADAVQSLQTGSSSRMRYTATEVYNNELFDLNTARRRKVTPGAGRKRAVNLPLEEAVEDIRRRMNARTVSPTTANGASSRSHLITYPLKQGNHLARGLGGERADEKRLQGDAG